MVRSDARHVLICAKAFPPALGGVETYSEQVAFAYARAGYAPVVVTQLDSAPNVSERRNGGSTIVVHNVGPGSQGLVFLRMLKRIRELRSSLNIAFCHATTWRVAIPLLVLRFPRVVLSVHGREIAQTRRPFTILMRSVLRSAFSIVIVSEYAKKMCARYSDEIAERAIVAWNGRSWVGDLHPRELDRPFRILTACQLTQRKNVAASILAVKELAARGESVELIIAGDGPERNKLTRLCAQLNVDSQVRFLGTVPRDLMPSEYMAANLFLHPQTHLHDSRDFESFCIAVADAMSFGLPTIAGQDGAPADYISNGSTGWLVDGNDVGSISDIVQEIVADRELRQRVGEAARVFASKHFSWDAHVDKVIRSAAPPRGDASDLVFERTKI